MLHEKAGDLFHWKNKLDELDHLPGEPPADKEAAWQKLHGRLQQKPRPKRVMAYWTAAACLLLALGGWWPVKQSGSMLVKSNGRQMPVNATLPVPATGNRDTVAVAVQLPAKTAHPVSGKPKNKIYQPTLKNAAVADQSVALHTDSMKIALPEITAPAMQQADAMRTIAAAPAKKKLRVVHINTLGKAEEEVLLAGNTSTPYPQAKLINRDEPANFSTRRNASDNIVKIKLSSSN